MRKSNHSLALPSSMGLGLTAAIADAFGRAVHTAMVWRERARERRQLLAMGERELHDIAITRVDALREASKPLWKE